MPPADRVIVDEKNRDLLKPDGRRIPWLIDERGLVFYNGRVDGKLQRVYLHRLVAERMVAPRALTRNDRIRHRNGNKQDNREDNLLITDYSQQGQARVKRAGCTSRYRGVSWWEERQKWHAKIVYHDEWGRKVERSLGLYPPDREKEAALAYDREALRRFPHPVLNFPELFKGVKN